MPAKPTAMQAKAMQLIREGEKPTIAMRKAGYSRETSRTPSKNLLGLAGTQSILDQYKAEYLKVGITPQYLAKKTAEWLDAVKVSTSLTEPDRVVPDYQTQLKAAEMIRKDIGITQEQALNFTQFKADEMNVTFRPAPPDGKEL